VVLSAMVAYSLGMGSSKTTVHPKYPASFKLPVHNS
jgi:hypothetical protein